MATAFENRVLELTNAYRAQNGLPALTMNETLVKSAEGHSSQMATIWTGFSHTDYWGRNPAQRNEAAGYKGTSVAENIAGASYSQTPEQVVQGWINSPGHRANLLNRDATEMGVGRYEEQSDVDRDGLTSYTTQVFGTKNGALPAPRANVLVGTDGNDVLTGGAGTQYLVGGKGNDVLTGGAGTDYFIFTSLDQGMDRITDYNPAEDKIYFVGRDFDGLNLGTVRPVMDFSTGTMSVNGTDMLQIPGANSYSWNSATSLSQVPGL